jgi:hypothetical protein
VVVDSLAAKRGNVLGGARDGGASHGPSVPTSHRGSRARRGGPYPTLVGTTVSELRDLVLVGSAATLVGLGEVLTHGEEWRAVFKLEMLLHHRGCAESRGAQGRRWGVR